MVAYVFCEGCCLTLCKNESGLDGQCKKMMDCLMVREMRRVSGECLMVDTRRHESRECQGHGKSRFVWRRDG